jgi:hypothetical protein
MEVLLNVFSALNANLEPGSSDSPVTWPPGGQGKPFGVGGMGSHHDLYRVALVEGVAASAGIKINGAFCLTDPSQVNEAFAKLFGVKLITGLITPKTGKRVGGEREVLFRYDPKAIQVVFDNLYVKPSEGVFGYSAQQFYDVVFKNQVASIAEVLARLLKKPGFIQSQSAGFLRGFETLDEFYSPEYALESIEKLYGEHRSTFDKSTWWDAWLMGTLLRRHIDGSLPTLLQILRTVLSDYDKKTFKELGPSLRLR